MSSPFARLSQPLLTLAAFGAGVAVALASARLAATGASTVGAWATGALAGAAFAAASWMLSRTPAGDEAAGAPAEAAEAERRAPSPGSSTERMADADWRAVARGDDGLRRFGVAAGDVIADE